MEQLINWQVCKLDTILEHDDIINKKYKGHFQIYWKLFHIIQIPSECKNDILLTLLSLAGLRLDAVHHVILPLQLKHEHFFNRFHNLQTNSSSFFLMLLASDRWKIAFFLIFAVSSSITRGSGWNFGWLEFLHIVNFKRNCMLDYYSLSNKHF